MSPAGLLLATMVLVPIQVGVTVTRPCELSAPVTVTLDAGGKPVVSRDGIAHNCGATPQISVAVDSTKGDGYVVSIGF